MKQVLTVPDASGLTPLELPAALARQEGDTGRPPPSQDAVSRFQAAMGAAQPVAGQVESGKWKVVNIFSPPAETPVGPEGLESPEGLGGRGNPSTLQPFNPSTPAVPTSAAPATPSGLEGLEKQEGRGNPSILQPFNPSTLPTSATLPQAVVPNVDGETGNGEQGMVERPNDSTIQRTNGPTAERSNGPTVERSNDPTVERSNDPTVELLNGQTVERPNGSTAERLNGSTVERPNGSTNQRINEPTNKRLNGPAVERPNSRMTKQLNFQTAEEAAPLQAAPIAMPNETVRAAAASAASPAVAVELEIDPAAATARTQELVDAAAVVADTILVTPSLVHGEGEVTIRLRPTVLDGSEIRLEARGEAITVALTPATPEVQRLAEQSQARFAAELSERIPSFQIAVVVNPRQTISRRDLRDETA